MALLLLAALLALWLLPTLFTLSFLAALFALCLSYVLYLLLALFLAALVFALCWLADSLTHHAAACSLRACLFTGYTLFATVNLLTTVLSWQLLDAFATSLAISCCIHAPLFDCWLLSCLCYFTVNVDLFTSVSLLSALFASVSILAALFFSVSLLAALFAHVSLLAALLVLRALLSKTQEFDETFPSAGVAGSTVM